LFLLVIFLVCAEDLSFFTPNFLITGASTHGARSVSSASGLVFRCQRFSSSLIISVAHGCYSSGTPVSRRGLGSFARRRPSPARPRSRFQSCDDSTALTRFPLPMLCCLLQSGSWMSIAADFLSFSRSAAIRDLLPLVVFHHRQPASVRAPSSRSSDRITRLSSAPGASVILRLPTPFLSAVRFAPSPISPLR
jgi:hypothetical protein